MSRPVAAIGVGQTTYAGRHEELSTPELVFQAVSRAIADAAIDISDVDAVVFASAPEVFEGVHEPDKWCAAAFGQEGKPVMRIHTGGATGGSAAIAGTDLVAAGAYDTVLVVGLQRTAESSDAQQIFTTIFDPVYEADIQLNVITTVAMEASRQIKFFGLTEDHMSWVSVKNHLGGSLNPYSHLHKQVTESEVRSSRMLAWPLRLLDACPRSDGACAIVLTSERHARNKPAAWIKGTGSASHVYRIGDRIRDGDEDFAGQYALGWACAKAYARAGISNPREQLDVIEVYAPFSNIEVIAYEAMGIAPRGMGWLLVEQEATARSGDIPVVPSGGCMTANPIGATGLVRFAEAALQVMGRAGNHQIDGVRTALATATGGINQFFTAAVLSAQLQD